MNFTLGLFDLFTYAVPGSLHLAILIYVAEALGWIDVTQAANISSVLLIITIAIASFLLGHITYPLASLAERVLRLRDLRGLDAKRDFVAKYPGSTSRHFLQADPSLLLAAVELHDKEVSTEIVRLRSVGLMLRNSSLALAFATVTELVRLTIGGDRIPVTVCAIVFLLATVGSYWQGQTLRHWANSTTLEICSLILDIDDKIKPLTGEHQPK
jgi:hypothetical protein